MSTHAREGIVRDARRPEGWNAPGPRPRGANGRPELRPGAGEDLCCLAGDWRIFQRLDGHRWSLDDLATAWLAARAVGDRPFARFVDLGCGIGAVLMMVAWRFPDARGIGVEAQVLSAGLARRSLEYNGADERSEVRLGDFRDSATLPEGPVFDLVTGTPPYIPRGAGRESERVQCAPCRFEHRGGIEDYCHAASRLLAPGGRFAVCASWLQRERTVEAAKAAHLRIVERRDVLPREGKAPLFSVYVMRHAEDAKAGEPPMRQAVLVIRDAAGRWTKEFLELRAEMGFPPR